MSETLKKMGQKAIELYSDRYSFLLTFINRERAPVVSEHKQDPVLRIITTKAVPFAQVYDIQDLLTDEEMVQATLEGHGITKVRVGPIENRTQGGGPG